MQDLLNAGQVLNRSEMKKIMAGSGPPGAASECTCETDECMIVIYTHTWGWEMEGYCDGTGQFSYDGTGPYGGTVCHGQCP